MNKYLNYLVAYLLSLAALSSCSDDNEPTPVPVPDPTPSGYCLMFYMSGGDKKHDITLMESARQAAAVSDDNVAVTVLHKNSGEGEGEAHNGTHRYTAQNGVLTEDPTFDPGEDFAITDPKELTDFIRWSVEKYPNRHYLLVIGGHGKAFVPYEDEDASAPKTRSTLYDDHNYMSSAQLGNAIRQSNQNLDALIFNSCQQGNIEMLAEWEGTADYLLSSPFSIPDFGYDYASLIGDLQQGRSVEEALARTTHRAINLWQEFHNQEECGMVTQVSRIRDLTPLWETMRQIIGAMKNSMEDINFTTDAPAVYGQPYGQGYGRALYSKYVGNEDDFFEYNRPTFALDIVGFFHAAYVQSGNMSLAPYINRLDEILADVIVTHRQTNGKHDFIYLVFNALTEYDMYEGETGILYRKCRFDKLTGWRDFYENLRNFVYNYEEKGEILTPISEHIVGRWEVKDVLIKKFHEWLPASYTNFRVKSMVFRSNGEMPLVDGFGQFAALNKGQWSIKDGNKIDWNGEELEIYQLSDNVLELGYNSGAGKEKVRLSRVDDSEKTLGERMVGKWSLSKRYEKVNSEWKEVTENLPLECRCEYTESGLFSTYTRWSSEEWKNDDMLWRFHEQTGTVFYFDSEAQLEPRFFRIALEDNDNTMIMSHSENFNPELEEQTSTEYKDILIRN